MKAIIPFTIALAGFAAPALAYSEAFPNPRIRNAFQIIDQNADGFLTASEIAAVVR